MDAHMHIYKHICIRVYAYVCYEVLVLEFSQAFSKRENMTHALLKTTGKSYEKSDFMVKTKKIEVIIPFSYLQKCKKKNQNKFSSL